MGSISSMEGEDMVNEEEDQEEVVLKRWDKMKQWWSMGSAAVQVIKWSIVGFKMLFVGSAVAVVAGEVTDNTFVKDTAIEIGLIEPLPIDTTKGMLQEELVLQLATMQQKLLDLEEAQKIPPDNSAVMDEILTLHEEVAELETHEHEQIAAVVVPEKAHTHKEYAEDNHTHDEIEALRKELRGHEHEMLPPVAGASDKVIDDAFLQHIADDH